jgi:hypothetical protein
MAATDTLAYVVGARQTGILYLTLDPLRVSMISRETIQSYADQNGESFEVAFGRIAGATQDLILSTDVEDAVPGGQITRETFIELIKRGTTICDADFCFVAKVKASEWGTMRNGFAPIEPVIDSLDRFPGGVVPRVSLGGQGGQGQP